MKRVVFNQKGGVGKTSITCNLAAIGAAMGYRTLVVDLDVQGKTEIVLPVKDSKNVDFPIPTLTASATVLEYEVVPPPVLCSLGASMKLLTMKGNCE